MKLRPCYLLIALGGLATVGAIVGMKLGSAPESPVVIAPSEPPQPVRQRFARRDTIRPQEIDQRARPPQVAELTSARAQSLRSIHPNVQIELDPITGSPSFVQVTGKFLTPPHPDKQAREIVEQFISDHPALFRHGGAALKTAKVTRHDVAKSNGMTTLVLQQELSGLSIFQAILKANVTRNGELITISDHFVTSPKPNVREPKIDSTTAMALVAKSLNDKPQHLTDTKSQLTYVPLNESDVRLAWDVTAFSSAQNEMYHTLVDAQNGDILYRTSLTNQISDSTFRVFADPATKKPMDSPTPLSPGHSSPLTSQPAEVARHLISLQALDTTASPHGWIDDGNQETSGNNVMAHSDTDANNSADLPRPNGGAARIFDSPLDLTQPPSSYRDGAITQLFYINNWVHDRLYQLGFTESAGNFQVNNFGRGGVGNDAVQADAQDGSGLNNANFSTPTDGSPGRMQMFVWSGPTPDRDAALDAEIVIHEYAHGLTNRLVGGGTGITALQARGLGEGWSDFYALALLSDPADDVHGTYAVGAYTAQFLVPGLNTNYYFGIRRYPYTTDMAKNPLTFKDISTTQASAHSGTPLSPQFSASNAAPASYHAQGEVWCSMLWEVRANLINKYGWSGNERMLQLVTDALKLSPANPTFTQARDAIIQADLVTHAGADATEIWAGFAKRGLGFGANNPGAGLTTPVTEIFDLPDALTVALSSIFTPSATRFTGPITPSTRTYTLANTGTTALSWTATCSQPWVTLSPTNGNLAAGATTIVTATINSSALQLPSGVHSDFILFTKSGSSITRSREVSLTVTSPLTKVFSQPLDTDPQWSRAGEWAFGTPTGAPVAGGSPDPTSGYTGSNVFGIALAGGYSTVTGGAQYLISSPINTTGMSNVKLRFRRWLSSQGFPYTYQTFSVSNDGNTWTSIPGVSFDYVKDTAWVTAEIPLGTIANNQPTVYLRWGHQISMSEPRISYCGWNIDDIELLASTDTPGLTATPQSVSTPLNTPLQVTLAGADTAAPGASLSYGIVSQPAHGTLSGTLPNLTYTPDTGYVGSDMFSFTVTSMSGTSAPGVVSIVCVPVPPEISIEQPGGQTLVSGSSTLNFGNVHVGAQSAISLTIKNLSGGPLNLGGASVDGPDSGDFMISPPNATQLLAGEQAYFRVTFAPSLVNTRTATLHVTSNDTNEASFDLSLTGNGTVVGSGISLLKDINSLPAGVSPGYLAVAEGAMTVIGGLAYYPASSLDAGMQLWRTDGTPQGTFPLKSIGPAPVSSSLAECFPAMNGKLYFAASSSNTELWTTDGTVNGTVLVKDINPGSNSSSPARFCTVGSVLYFVANDGTTGTELWKTDGSDTGTVLVKDIAAGSASSTPTNLINMNGTLFFSANDGVNGIELWKSDGTAAGTVLVKDCFPGASGSSPTRLVAGGSTLFFMATDPTNGTELWKSDGTAGGTQMVRDINLGTASGYVFDPVFVGGKLIFGANDATGSELWCSDGTGPGTIQIKDINPGTSSSGPLYLTQVGATVFFTANDGLSGNELWKTDGTPAGTVQVKNIAPGSLGSTPRALRASNGKLVFSAAADGGTGYELWTSDGTSNGTFLVKDINPGTPASNPLYFTAMSGFTVFSANDGSAGFELWRTDGTEAGTWMVTDAQTGTSGSSPSNLRNFNGELVFSADNGTSGRELWQCAGTLASTQMIRDFGSTSVASNPPLALSPTNITVAGNRLYFSGTDNTGTGTELWKSDGTSDGTVLVKDINSGSLSSSPSQIVAAGSRVFFSATGSTTQGAELWISDGTSTGTTLVKDINPAPNSGSGIANGVELNGNLIFAANDGTNGSELWVSDGTTTGTTMLADINPGSSSSSPSNLRVFNGVVYFSAFRAANGTELWKTDGTAGGTVMIADINSGTISSAPGNFVAMNGVVYFTALTSAAGVELWKTDGTLGGTSMVKDISSGAASSSPSNLTVIGSTLYFSAFDLGLGSELWKSDGTSTGTIMVKDIMAGSGSSLPGSLVNVNGTLCFTANTTATGTELWTSDGSAAGTSMVAELVPGAGSSLISQLTAVGSRLYFTARLPGLEAVELFQFEPGTPPDIAVEYPLGSGLVSGADTVNWGNFSLGSDSSLMKSFVIRNTGERTLTLTNMALEGTDAGAYSIGTNLTGASLQSGESRTLNVSFSPVSLGMKNASLRISSNDADESPFVVHLSGNSVAASEISVEQPEGGALTSDISTVAVGHAQVGGSDSYQLLVRNLGSSPLDMYGAGIDGDHAADFSAEINSIAIPAGGSATLLINFTPSALGARRAVLHLYSSDGDESSFNITLSGIGSAEYGPLSMVKDINSQGSSPGVTSITSFGGVLIFAATTPESGTELWKTDGTPAGTQLIKDIATGPASSSPANFRMAGSTLYFTATNIVNGVELWKTDGSTAGTVMVKDINSGGSSSNPSQLTNVNGTLFFMASEAATGQELWKSDGTASGTVLVKDIAAGTSGSSGGLLTAKGSSLMFVANDLTNGSELWSSDGTTGGTVLVKNINTTTGAGASIANMAVVNGLLLFNANDGITGNELWRSDGTNAGTTQVLDTETGSASSHPQNFTPSGSLLFYRATSAVYGGELWCSDGTPAGTRMVKDVYPGFISSMANPMVSVADNLGGIYFMADDGVHGLELWHSDGTSDGTHLVADINPGTANTNWGPTLLPMNFSMIGGTLYFSAATDLGSELWKSDGSAAGTVRVTDLNPGSGSALPAQITALGNQIIFVASNGPDGQELWITNGTTAGTSQLTDLVKGSSPSAPALLRVLDDSLLFTANDGVIGAELWSTDGRLTSLLKDINAGPNGAAITSPVVMETPATETTPAVRRMYFSANYITNVTNFYSTNGTPEGTQLIKSINGSTGTTTQIVPMNGRLYFSANDSTNGAELWTSDGTTAGTALVTDLYPGAASSSPANLTPIAGQLLFTASTPATGAELWRTDGTATGTTLVKDITPGTGGSSFVASSFAVSGGKLFFAANNGTSGSELWVTDGTLAGTAMVADINPGAASSGISGVVSHNGRVFFSANNGTNGNELWTSDGTLAGTVMVKDIYAGISASAPFNLVVAGDTLFFTAFDPAVGTELWKTDGTSTGTVLVKDIFPGTSSSAPQNLANIGGLLYFSAAASSVQGAELWRSDGTGAATQLVADLRPAANLSSSPGNFTLLNGRVYFTATGPDTGSELWSLDVSPRISVEHPVEVTLEDGSSSVDFGTVSGSSSVRTFTVRNNGFYPLNLEATNIDGPDRTEFTQSSMPPSIAPGATSTFDVTFVPADEGVATAQLHVFSDDPEATPYDINLTGKKISSLESWRLVHFGSMENAGSANDAADADGDGLTNLLEFAFGTSPTTSGAGSLKLNASSVTEHGLPLMYRDGNTMCVIYLRQKNHAAMNLTYTPMFSSDLIHWEPSAVTPTIVGQSDSHEAACVPFMTTVAGQPARFCRIDVTRSP